MRILWPTKRGWATILGGGIWFLIAIVNRSLYAYLFACTAAGLSVASLISAVLSLHGVELRRATAGDAATGQPVSLPLIIRNRFHRSRQPIVVAEHFLFTAKSLHAAVVKPLKGSEERLIDRRVLALRRGEFPLKHVFLRSGDPAGLFMRERCFCLPQTILILPGAEPIPDLHLCRKNAVISTTDSPLSAIGTNQEFYSVREYNPSDGLRYIHWKSSARYGRLMVREFERNTVTSVAVLLDGQEDLVSGPGPDANLEYQIRVAASICSHMAGLYCQFAFAAGGSQSILMHSRPASEAKQDVLYNLAIMKSGHIPLDAMVYELGEQLPPETVVFCLSLGASERLRRALRVLQEQGMTIRWLCAHPSAFATVDKHPHKPAVNVLEDHRSLQPAEVRPGFRVAQIFAENGMISSGWEEPSAVVKSERLAAVS